MEGNENPWELNSVASALLFLILIEIMTLSSPTISNLSYNDPLFSCIITLSTLILLYFPHALQISLSPVLLLTATLLLFLLRLGAIQRLHQTPITENEEKHENKENNHGDANFDIAENSSSLAQLDKWVACQTEATFDRNPNPRFEESFVKWDVSAPLEVIYETYEGEEDEENPNGSQHRVSEPNRFAPLQKYPSLSMYYPETDSDSSSDGGFSMNGEWDSPDSVYFKWEEEDREGLLIEIALDSNAKKDSGLCLDFQVEEDNLIEIDISPMKNDITFAGEV